MATEAARLAVLRAVLGIARYYPALVPSGIQLYKSVREAK